MRQCALLEIGVEAPSAWRDEAARLGVGLDVVRLDQPGLRDLYGADLLLVRPDMYVAWRGSADSDARAPLCRAIGRV
ncbi:hypothetical protein HY78_29870 (plasmid) [Rhizorhabdus wittichii DC-6]|nr:hypothetical protein HY78_29870 [Rhizorhabdus wittichii DC-6]